MKKLTVKELKALVSFEAVSGTGKKATFIVNGDEAVGKIEGGEEKTLKLTAIAKTWKITSETPALGTAEAVVTQEAQAPAQPETVVPEGAVDANVTEKEAKLLNALAAATAELDVADLANAAGLTTKVAKGLVGSLTKKGFVKTETRKDGETEFDVIVATPEWAGKFVKSVPPVASAPKPPKPPKAPATRNADTFVQMVRTGKEKDGTTPLTVVKTEEGEQFTKTVYTSKEGVSLEYYAGKDNKWELLKSKKNGGWHGEFFNVDGNRVKGVKVGDKEMAEPSKSKSFVQEYLKAVVGIEVTL